MKGPCGAPRRASNSARSAAPVGGGPEWVWRSSSRPPHSQCSRGSVSENTLPHAAHTWLVTARGHPARALAARTARGARALEVPRRGRHLDLGRALEQLAGAGLTQILAEGGGGLAAALLRAGLVDELHWFVAPSVLGGDARSAVAALGVRSLSDRVRFEISDMRRLGPDLYVHARLRS